MKLFERHHLIYVIPLSIVVLGVYVFTMPYGYTWKHFGYDAGDLISCVYTWGIPHPPGTPLYVVVGQLFRWLPFFSTPAGKFNFMSAFFAWLSVLMAYFSGFELTGDKLFSWLAAAFFAFTPLFWGQAIIAEVLTLNLFLASLFVYFLVAWERSDCEGNRKDQLLFAAIFVFGLALTNHTSVITFAPPLIFLVLAVSPKKLTEPRVWIKMLGFFFLGLLPYLYLPLRASMEPTLNWGNPDNLSRFIAHVTAKDYQSFLFVAPSLLLDNFTRFIQLVWANFNPFGVLAIVLGIFLDSKGRGKDFLIFAAVFQLIFIFNYNIVNIETYFLPVFFILTLLLASGLSLFRPFLESWVKKVREREGRLFAQFNLPCGLGVKDIKFSELFRAGVHVLLFAVVLINLPLHWSEASLRKDKTSYNYGRDVFGVLEPNAVVLAEGDKFYLGLKYFNHVVFPEHDDVAILHLAFFYDRNWMLEQARRNHPHLKYPFSSKKSTEESVEKELMAFVDANFDHRPIYLAVGEVPLSKNRVVRKRWGNFIIQSEGPIYRVVERVDST